MLSGVESDKYRATRMLRSSVEREFTIIGEAIAVLSRTDPQLFSRITNGRRIGDSRNRLTHAYLHVDDRIVWLIARNDVPHVRAGCEERELSLAAIASQSAWVTCAMLLRLGRY